MVSYPETERLETIELREIYSLTPILEELTRIYTGDPLFLVELKEFIDTLNNKDKAIIYLRYFGLSTDEISQELGKSRRRIEQRLKRIRERARGWIG